MAKKDKQYFTCPHCDKQVDFDVDYCYICESHSHKMFMSEQVGVCRHCEQMANKKSREWHRARRKLSPLAFGKFGWDQPEWYDLDTEWRNSTIDFVWVHDEYGIETV